MFIYLRLIRESYLFAMQSLLANKLRTTLSLLGITIGIFAIISVFTLVDSLELKLKKSMESLGNNVVFVQKWPWVFGGDFEWWKYFQRPVANTDDLKEIKKRSQCAEMTGMFCGTNKNIEYLDRSTNNVIVIATHEYKELMQFDLANGRYFSEMESGIGKPVCIIGDDIAKNLFVDEDPVGKKVKIFGRKIEVIGVFKREGSSALFGKTNDDRVVVPLNYAKNIVNIRSDMMDPTIIVKAKPNVSVDELCDELTGIMRSVRKLKTSAEDNFAINKTTSLNQNFDSIFATLTIAGWFIGGLSLLVGGFGIANIMFVSVRERTHLIGIQKSLGAKNYFILFQFLFESIFLSLFGGILGLIIVFLITLLVKYSFDFELFLTFGNITLGLFVSITIGFFAGMIPAWVASRLNPVDAIRTN